MKKYIKLILIVALISGFFINRGCNQRQRDKLVKTITELETKNNMLAAENGKLNKEIKAKDLLIKANNQALDSVNKLFAKAKGDAAYWKKQHDRIIDELESTSYDDSYAFLMMVYSFTGSFKYQFNEPQVRAMHKTYLENENKIKQIESTEAALNECEAGTDLLKENIELLQSKYNIKEQQYTNQIAITDNKSEEIKALQKQLKRKVFWTKVKNVAIPVAFAAGIVVGL
jgi:predicted nuclease with TOPRIM domain